MKCVRRPRLGRRAPSRLSDRSEVADRVLWQVKVRPNHGLMGSWPSGKNQRGSIHTPQTLPTQSSCDRTRKSIHNNTHPMPNRNIRGRAAKATHVLQNAYREKTPTAITLPVLHAALPPHALKMIVFQLFWPSEVSRCRTRQNPLSLNWMEIAANLRSRL